MFGLWDSAETARPTDRCSLSSLVGGNDDVFSQVHRQRLIVKSVGNSRWWTSSWRISTQSLRQQRSTKHVQCSRIADVFHHVQDADRWADTRRQAEIISDTSDADRILSAASETVLVPPWLPLASAARLSMEHEYETCSITENNFWYSYFFPFPFLWTHSHTHSRHLWILIFIVIPSQFPMCFYCF